MPAVVIVVVVVVVVVVFVVVVVVLDPFVYCMEAITIVTVPLESFGQL